MSRKTKKILKNINAKMMPYTVLFLLVAVVFSGVYMVLLPGDKSVRADTIDTNNWSYYKEITISDKVNEYQTLINITKTSGGDVDCEGHCNDNFSDLRFADAENNLVPYFICRSVSGSYAQVLVNNSFNDTTLYMYYGNSNAANESNGSSTFDFFDGFDGTSQDPLDQWTEYGTIDWSSDGYVALDEDDELFSDDSFSIGRTVHTYVTTNEQDVTLCAFYEAHGQEDNRTTLESTDAGGLSLTELRFQAEDDVSYTRQEDDIWSDPTAGYYHYCIRWDTDYVNASQNDVYATSTITANVPDVSLTVALRAWDSSQASTLTADWVGISKFDKNTQPSYSFGGENSISSATYEISGLNVDTRFIWSGEAGQSIWANDTGATYETLAIHTNVSLESDNCTDIFVDFGSLGIDSDITEEHINITVARNISDFTTNLYQVPSDGNVTINASVWDAQSWCAGDNPFPIVGVNITIYVRARISIPSGKDAGTYTNASGWAVKWKVVS